MDLSFDSHVILCKKRPDVGLPAWCRLPGGGGGPCTRGRRTKKYKNPAVTRSLQIPVAPEHGVSPNILSMIIRAASQWCKMMRLNVQSSHFYFYPTLPKVIHHWWVKQTLRVRVFVSVFVRCPWLEDVDSVVLQSCRNPGNDLSHQRSPLFWWTTPRQTRESPYQVLPGKGHGQVLHVMLV